MFKQLGGLGKQLHVGGSGQGVSCKPLWDLWDLVGVVRQVVIEQAHCGMKDVFGVQSGGEKGGQLFLGLGDEK